MATFWDGLPRPFFVLAPMANVTDTVFRRMIARLGRPHVMFTEFVSCDGLMSTGREQVIRDLRFTGEERPLVAQVFGSRPENIYESAKLIRELGFDGIDINMGCPDKHVCKQGAGAALMKNPTLAREIVIAAKEGAGDVPVSVKTRIGYSRSEELESWIGTLLQAGVGALTVHARTKREMSKVPARWEHVREVVRMAQGTGTVVVGNGDVRDIADARSKAMESGADGVMIGRAVFGNPWVFRADGYRPTVEEKLHAMIGHAQLFTEEWGAGKSMESFRKYACKTYAHGFDGASTLRAALMRCKTSEEVEVTTREFLVQKNRSCSGDIL